MAPTVQGLTPLETVPTLAGVPGFVVQVSPLIIQFLGFLAFIGAGRYAESRRKQQVAACRAYAQPTPPPADLSPGLAYKLANQDFEPLAILLGLGVSGAVRFELRASEKRDDERLRAVLVDEQRIPHPVESEWADRVFATLKGRNNLGMESPYYYGRTCAEQAARRELKKRGWTTSRFLPVRFLIAAVAVSLYALSFYAASFAGLEIHPVVQGITWVAGLMFGLMALFELGPTQWLTPAGEAAVTQVYGVGLEMDRVLAAGDCEPAVAEALLPWAAVLGREDEWFELLRRLEWTRGYRPLWLTGTPHRDDGHDKWAAFTKLAHELAQSSG